MTVHAKVAMSDSHWYRNLCLINYELDINLKNFENWLFSIVVSPIKVKFRMYDLQGLLKENGRPGFMLEPINFRKELIEAYKVRFCLMFLFRGIDIKLCYTKKVTRTSTNCNAVSLSLTSVCITKFLGFSQYPFLVFNKYF